LFAAAYGDHPYAAPANGRARERDAITLAQLTSYANARLSPGNALLTIVGRFDADSALAAARRAFGAIPARGAVSEPEPPPPAAQGERRGVARVASPVALVLCGWRAPGGSDSSRVALRVLSRMLTDGPTAAFSRALVQRKDPLLVGVQGDVDVRRDGSLLYLFAPVRPGLDSSAVESALALEAERFARDSVEADEVERAKKAIEIEWLTARQTSRGRAAALGEAMLQSGDWREADRDLERLRALDARVVQRLAQQVLRSENSVTVWVWPLSAPGGEASR
jgi:zinc protease